MSTYSTKPESKKELEMILSKLRDFESPKLELEQYSTSSSIAAHIAWTAYMRGDVRNKLIADLGAGNGILSIACALLGAKKVFAVELDPEAVKIAEENYRMIKRSHPSTAALELIQCDVGDFDLKVDTVIMNPPFGVRKRHADVPFLEKAFEVADKVYVVHQIESNSFYRAFAGKRGFKSTLLETFDFPLKMTMKFHAKRTHKFKAGLWLFEK